MKFFMSVLFLFIPIITWGGTMEPIYVYNARVISVYDGDTIRVDIDLGFNMIMKDQSIRLYGINTPEMRGSDKVNGKISRDRLRALILDKDIVLQTLKDKKGKYGRWIGIIWKNDVNINEQLVEEGLAVEYMK